MSASLYPQTIAAVEAGGTTFVVAVAKLSAEGNLKIVHKTEVDSAHDNPTLTLEGCANFLKKHKPSQGYHSLGIASFGPVGVNVSNSDTYGSILSTTPKANWRNVNLLQPIRDACSGSLPLKVMVDTDVNAPALAEFLLEDGKISSLAYVTCGTGVGVGLVVHGKCVHGRMHPEAGHVPVQPLPNDEFKGYSWGTSKSPFRGVHTVEGIASSVALTERLQQMQGAKVKNRNVLSELPDNHEIWDHAANALANLCVTLLLTTSMEKIVLGGGVMKRNGLIEKIQKQTVTLLNGYLELPRDMSTLVSLPKYGDEAGLMGALTLAKRALESEEQSCGKESIGYGVLRGAVLGAAVATALMFTFFRPKP